MIAVGAGRYHSAVCTEHEVFTFGKNLGQLGMCVCVHIHACMLSKLRVCATSIYVFFVFFRFLKRAGLSDRS